MNSIEPAKIFHLHLVSDATGETINSVARACLAQFDQVEPHEHAWTLIRTSKQLENVLAGIEAHPGPVLFTMVNEKLRMELVAGLPPAAGPLHPGARSRDHGAGQSSGHAGARACRDGSMNWMPNISAASMP